MNEVIGDKVRIRKDSDYYGLDEGDMWFSADYAEDASSNPADTDGVVTELDLELLDEYQAEGYDMADCHYIKVEWDNGTYNWYTANDLEIVSSEILT